ncbi:chromosomal replication initiator protein DnaA [Lachnospiraceae bacterium oral taxon 500]|nr:chromosomal replication initiator protein DnaA [Lachnospiraceae bacterium oral taxon 500]
MDNPVIHNWESIQQVLKNDFNIKEQIYNAFLADIYPAEVSGDQILIELENTGHISFLENNYSKIIQVAISMVTDKNYEIRFSLKSKKSENTAKESVISSDYDNNEDVYHLNKRYTFENFVVGSNNKFANAAALAVAEFPSSSYNPLFIYGGVGLGKTHLMHAIAHYIFENHKHLNVLYVSSETFTNEMIQSIHSNKNEEFRRKYRNIDVLLVDDIQFISGKEGTQEEFFHTFNTLHEAKKQIIISSDRPPKDIETLEERLRSRFSGGLIVDVQPPDFETRMAILKNKTDFDLINIDDDVLEYIANNVKSNIRELEGAVNKIVAFNNYNHNRADRITMDIAEEALKDSIISVGTSLINPSVILNIVAEHFSISNAEILSKKRSKEIVEPRQIVMYLCRKLTDASYPDLGKFFNRDHSTVISGYEKICAELKSNRSLQKNMDILIKKINNR